MEIIEARNALQNTLESIADEARAKGLIANTEVFITDIDFNRLDEDSTSGAYLIAGEISLGIEDSPEKMIFECALSLSDGEANADEMTSEISTIKANVREFIRKFEELGSFKKALDALSPEEEAPAQAPTYDNKSFYIYAGIGVAILVILMVLVGKIF